MTFVFTRRGTTTTTTTTDCCYQVMLESLETFQPASSKVKTKTMPSKIGFRTLTSDDSLYQKTDKQTNHE